MNRIMRRWVKAGALIFVATLVVAACEGPAGPTGTAGADGTDGTAGARGPAGDQGSPGNDGTDGTDGMDGMDGGPGIQGPPGVGTVALGFSYVPFNEPEPADGEAAPDAATAPSMIPSRQLAIPFGEYDRSTANRGTDDYVAPSRSNDQCKTIGNESNAVPIDLLGYMAFGGDNPTYSVSVTMGSGEDAMTIEEGHGFYLKTDMEGVEWLLDHHPDDMFVEDNGPNLAAADYKWTLHVEDEVGQMAHRSWNLRIKSTPFVAPRVATGGGEDDAELPDDDDATNGPEDWADFISSTFMPLAFGEARNTEDDAAMSHPDEGTVKAVDVSNTTNDTYGRTTARPYSSIDGMLDEDDIDVIWIGGLTPASVLDVMVMGTSEGSVTHDFNAVSVTLYRHVPDQAQGDAIASVASKTMGFMTDGVVYKGLDCGFYYLQVEGEMGDYTVSWSYEE